MEEEGLSDSGLAQVADLVRRYLPIHTLVQSKVVSKEWRVWCDENLCHLAKVRRKDESRGDWYFPIFVESDYSTVLLPRPWYGVHQWTKEHHTLPDLNFIPHDDWDIDGNEMEDDHELVFETTSSGLLLLSRLDTTFYNELIVCNPLTKKWRNLPRFTDCERIKCNMLHRMKLPFTDPVATHLMVDDMANKYRVVIVREQCVNVYSSSSNHWVCSSYTHYVPPPRSCVFNGCIYIVTFVHSQYFDTGMGSTYLVRVYDVESGKWLQIPTSYVTFHFTFGDCRKLPDRKVDPDYNNPDPVLVECMGDLYAVASFCYREEEESVENSDSGSEEPADAFLMKLQFHIFKMTQEGRLLEEPIPQVVLLQEKHVFFLWKHFNCVARSSTIHFAWNYRYILQYDVVTGFCTSFDDIEGWFERGYDCVGRDHRHSCMSYTPSLDLEP